MPSLPELASTFRKRATRQTFTGCCQLTRGDAGLRGAELMKQTPYEQLVAYMARCHPLRPTASRFVNLVLSDWSGCASAGTMHRASAK